RARHRQQLVHSPPPRTLPPPAPGVIYRHGPRLHSPAGRVFALPERRRGTAPDIDLVQEAHMAGNERGTDGVLVQVCLECGKEYMFEDAEPPADLKCDKCG